MEWDAYLESKKINPASYRQAMPEQYESFRELFLQMSPASFTAQKLFLINGIRRAHPLPPEVQDKTIEKKAARPVFKPKTS